MQDCIYFRGIKLDGVTYFEYLIIDRRLRDEQFAFMPGRWTADIYSRCGNVLISIGENRTVHLLWYVL